MNFNHLFSEEELEEAVSLGMVSRRKHPQWDLWILNYTPQAQYSRTWNDVTLNCRGLIVDSAGEIVARPFKKFFNYGEDTGVGDWDLSTPVRAFDKADGSLGIVFPTPDGGVEVATRGSFESEQAKWATQWLKRKGIGRQDFFNVDEMTHLCEIVYAENRIVLDYEGFEGLIGLASVEIETGKVEDCHPSSAFDRYVEDFPEVKTLKDALEMEPRPNAEGLVLRFDDGTHLKIKQTDYVELHRIMTGLSEKVIGEAWVNRKSGELLESLPDELYTWAENVISELDAELSKVASEVERTYLEVAQKMGERYTRKEFAQEAVKTGLARYLFLREDGRIKEMIEAMMKDVVK